MPEPFEPTLDTGKPELPGLEEIKPLTDAELDSIKVPPHPHGNTNIEAIKRNMINQFQTPPHNPIMPLNR